MSERRNKIVQWMLNQGRGIVDAPETCFLKETTEKEQAEHPFGSVRYVYSMVVNLFENEIPFPEQVDYAVETDMDMLDFDEWQGIQEILFGEDSDRAMKPECARAINTALWEYHDISPYEILERYDGLFAELDEAREKAVPTAPENVETSTLMDGYVWWTCRACGNLQHTGKQVQYCSYCGQSVKLENPEE